MKKATAQQSAFQGRSKAAPKIPRPRKVRVSQWVRNARRMASNQAREIRRQAKLLEACFPTRDDSRRGLSVYLGNYILGDRGLPNISVTVEGCKWVDSKAAEISLAEAAVEQLKAVACDCLQAVAEIQRLQQEKPSQLRTIKALPRLPRDPRLEEKWRLQHAVDDWLDAQPSHGPDGIEPFAHVTRSGEPRIGVHLYGDMFVKVDEYPAAIVRKVNAFARRVEQSFATDGEKGGAQ